MNFTYEMGSPEDGEWGIDKEGNWTGMVGQLQRREIDIGTAKHQVLVVHDIYKRSRKIHCVLQKRSKLSMRHLFSCDGLHRYPGAEHGDDLCSAHYPDLPQPLHQEPSGPAQLRGVHRAPALSDLGCVGTAYRHHSSFSIRCSQVGALTVLRLS